MRATLNPAPVTRVSNLSVFPRPDLKVGAVLGKQITSPKTVISIEDVCTEQDPRRDRPFRQQIASTFGARFIDEHPNGRLLRDGFVIFARPQDS